MESVSLLLFCFQADALRGVFSQGGTDDSSSHADPRSEEVQSCPQSSRIMPTCNYTEELQLIGFTSPYMYGKAVILTFSG